MSKVYFLKKDLKSFETNPKVLVKFLERTPLFSQIENKDLVGIKMHFGEDKNKGYLKPFYIKNLIERIKRIGAKPFLFDTNTLYRGKRTNAVDHFNLAFFEHNFKILNVPVIIADGLKSRDYIEVEIDGKHFKKVKITSLLKDLDFMLVLSHLTGHILTGFGASIKNIGMGCASRAGKMAQHCEVAPQPNHKVCILCKRCIKVCLYGAISLKENRIFIDQDKCIGCAQCISECPKGALKIVWSENYKLLQERMVEYAKAVLSISKKNFFINFSMFITKECDCMSKEESPFIEDLGILASSDVLSLDKATIDLLNQKAKRDVFKEIHDKKADYNFQFEYGQRIGLGELNYHIEEIGL